MVPFKSLRARGITLLETLLALAVGAIVIVASVQGLNRYTEGVQIQASASQMQRLIMAADTWANDNYEQVQAAAPNVYTIAQTQAALTPYLGGVFPQDAFRSRYRMVSRTYTYPVPDPANPGNTINRDAVQVLLVAIGDPVSPITTNQQLRVNLANTAGRGAGYISTANATCGDGAGGTLPAGNICGAYGSYALTAASFLPAGLTNAVVTGLITKGDSSFYGDQLYRYDYGDPDLNTMRTTLFMDSATNPNEIQSPRRQMTLRAQTAAGGTASITVGRQGVGVGGIGQGDILLDPGNTNRVVIRGAAGVNPSLRSSTGTLLMGDQTTLTRGGGSGLPATDLVMGDGDIRGDNVFASIVRTGRIDNLWRRQDAPLRLQQFVRGEVVIGQRAQYQAAGNRIRPLPSGAGSSAIDATTNYETSDGRLVAGHVVSQDITCADCGGSLSQILPRWRHMGTYFVGYTTGAGTVVPYPNCGNSRRNTITRAATTGYNPQEEYAETARDERYRPSILLIPRQIRSKDGTDVVGFDLNRVIIPFNSHLVATVDQNGTPGNFNDDRWRVLTHRPGDNVYTTAFALTYCVFTGGDTDPTSGATAGMFENSPVSHGTWVQRN